MIKAFTFSIVKVQTCMHFIAMKIDNEGLDEISYTHRGKDIMQPLVSNSPTIFNHSIYGWIEPISCMVGKNLQFGLLDLLSCIVEVHLYFRLVGFFKLKKVLTFSVVKVQTYMHIVYGSLATSPWILTTKGYNISGRPLSCIVEGKLYLRLVGILMKKDFTFSIMKVWTYMHIVYGPWATSPWILTVRG